MKKERRSAYGISYTKVELTEDERREALAWWQQGEDYHPLVCPVCGHLLSLAAQGVALECPRDWCSYRTVEIPWAVYVAYARRQTG